MKSVKFLFAILSTSLILLSSCSSNPEQSAEATPPAEVVADEVVLTAEQAQTLNIALGKIEKRQVSSVIKVNGMLDVPPQNLVTISAPLGGFIKHT